ncbi:vWA domain-containing protein [Allofranklinella schreckenbergeri]|nr:VWA domain-containing protein [Allofranklinella schreckenbergeri]
MSHPTPWPMLVLAAHALASGWAYAAPAAAHAAAPPEGAHAAASPSGGVAEKMQRCEQIRLAPRRVPEASLPVHRAQAMTSTTAPAVLEFAPAVLSQPKRNAAPDAIAPLPPAQRERYAHYAPNPVHSTAQQPVSTFSIDVDTGSYANVRRYLNSGHLPPADAVRLEEMVNYFSYDWAQPRDGQPFAVHSAVVDSPWQKHAKLLRIGIKAAEMQAGALPPANLVFLIDTSGSMDQPGKLDLAQKTVCYFAAHLRAQDTLTLITYAGSVGTLLPATAGDRFDAIYSALQQLSAYGSTAGESAIRMAYDSAEKHFKPKGINRILLATDGDFNVGISDTQALKSLVADKRNSGISLSTLGFGQGNYNDELMEQMADVGDGNYSYIDQSAEARKVLVRQLSSTLATVAHDVKVQVEFNPATVKEYRLVGYENRTLRQEDFNNDRVDAGDIGAGHSVTALYEFIPQGAPGWLEPRRYATPHSPTAPKAEAAQPNGAAEYAFIQLHYKPARGQSSASMSAPVAQRAVALDGADADTRFAIAAAAFGQALKGGQYNGSMDWAAIARLAESARGADPYGERQGMVELVRKAAALSAAR